MNYVITIGREYGSGGRYIGRELAKRLNIPFYDNELLEKVSEESGLCVDYLKENDEKKDSVFAFIGMSDNTNVFTAVQKTSLAQFRTIKKLAEEESCVIVGRCANYVLRHHKNVVNVFIHAPLEERIHRAVTYYSVDPKKAKDIIVKMDRKRSGYYNYFTDQKWGHSSNYDLCISSSIGIEETVDVIVELLHKKLHI